MYPGGVFSADEIKRKEKGEGWCAAPALFPIYTNRE
jgi:hypothetical protein